MPDPASPPARGMPVAPVNTPDQALAEPLAPPEPPAPSLSALSEASMADRRAFIREEETRLAAVSETAEEMRQLRREVRHLRSAASRCALLERDRLEAATLTKQLERHLQAKNREVSRLSAALQQAYVQARARSYQSDPSSGGGGKVRAGGGGSGGGSGGGGGLMGSRSRSGLDVASTAVGGWSGAGGVEVAVISEYQHKLQKRAKAIHAADAAAAADATAEGYELCQVLAEPPPPPPPPSYYAQQAAAHEADPIALLNRSQPRASPPANPHTIIRMRGKVYRLTELRKDAAPSLLPPEAIAERLASFHRSVALDPPPDAEVQQQMLMQPTLAGRKVTTGPVPVTVSAPMPPAAAPPSGPPRPAPHLRPHSASVARGRTTARPGFGAGGGDAPYVYHPPSTTGQKPTRPSSAQARLRTGPAGHRPAPQPGGDPAVDGVSRMVLAGALQQGHTKRWERYLEPGMLGY